MQKIITFIVVSLSVSAAYAQTIPLLRDTASFPEIISSNEFSARQVTVAPQAPRQQVEVQQAPLDNPGVYAAPTAGDYGVSIMTDIRQMNF